MDSHQPRQTGARRLIVVGAVCALLLSMATGVWAMPSQRGLRQTVPTRTPTKVLAPTDTPVPPPTDTPALAPTDTPAPAGQEPTATPESPTATPTKKASQPKPPTATPEPEPQGEAGPATATPAAEAEAAATESLVPAEVHLTATAAIIASGGMPVSGGDYRAALGAGLAGLLLACGAVYAQWRRRGRVSSGG